MIKPEPQSNYEAKFKQFIEMCESTKNSDTDLVVISAPEVLGDNYEELTESLRRLAEAELSLKILPSKS